MLLWAQPSGAGLTGGRSLRRVTLVRPRRKRRSSRKAWFISCKQEPSTRVLQDAWAHEDGRAASSPGRPQPIRVGNLPNIATCGDELSDCEGSSPSQRTAINRTPRCTGGYPHGWAALHGSLEGASLLRNAPSGWHRSHRSSLGPRTLPGGRARLSKLRYCSLRFIESSHS